jgi:hypothetical protein
MGVNHNKKENQKSFSNEEMGIGMGAENYTFKKKSFRMYSTKKCAKPCKSLLMYKTSHTVPSFFFCSDDAFT